MRKIKILHINIVWVWLAFSLSLPCASSLAANGVIAAPPISDREIIEKLVRLESGQEALESGQEALESGQEVLRAEMKSSNLALRSEMKSSIEVLRAEMKSGQEALNFRITDLRSEMKAGQEALRSEMKTGQDALNKRLDDSNNTMLVFFSAIITLIVALFAYIAWDRRTMIKPLVNKLDLLERNIVNDLDLYHSEGSLVKRQLQVLRKYARRNPEIAEIMQELSLLRNEPA